MVNPMNRTEKKQRSFDDRKKTRNKTWGKQPNFFIQIIGKPFGTKLLHLPQGRRAFWTGVWSLDFGFVVFWRFGMWWESNERDRKKVIR